MSFSQKPRKRVQISFKDTQSLTEQSHKDSCDIHNILKKSEKTGILEHVNRYRGHYGDMPTGEEFQEHMNIIAKTESMFETIPSKIRQKFENNPRKFLDFISDNKNYAEMREMGFDVSHLQKPENPIEQPITTEVEK